MKKESFSHIFNKNLATQAICTAAVIVSCSTFGSWTGLRWCGHEWEDKVWYNGAWCDMPWNGSYYNFVQVGDTIKLHAEWVEQDEVKGTCSYYMESCSSGTSYSWGGEPGPGSQYISFKKTGTFVIGALPSYSGGHSDTICFIVKDTCPSTSVSGNAEICIGEENSYYVPQYQNDTGGYGADHWSVIDNPSCVSLSYSNGRCNLTALSIPASGYVTLQAAVWVRGWVYPKLRVNIKNHDVFISTEAVAPTCTQSGRTKEETCRRCGKVFSASIVLPALGHNEVITTVATSPTCTVAGCTKGSYCSRCNDVLATSSILPSLGHVEVVTTEAVSPTCLNGGCTRGSKCSRCSTILSVSESLAALGHDRYVSKSEQQPSCTNGGWTMEEKCSRCQTIVTSSTPLSALGHAEVETKAAKAATCTEIGWTHEVTCGRCNSILEASVANPALGHIEVETKAATVMCTEAGWTHEVKCSRCNATLEASVASPALGHLRQTTIAAIEPTCTSDGRTAEVVCSRCGAMLESSEVAPALGHSGAIIKPAVEPTSSTPGKTAEITCSRCGEVLQAQTTIPALDYIRNVTARQLWPHNMVEVCYEVAEDINDVAEVDAMFRLLFTSGNFTKIAATISGDTSCTPGRHSVLWDAEADWSGHSLTDVVFKVMYASRAMQHNASDPAEYCIVDLSAGANASSYPVTYRTATSVCEFNTDEYKTSKLVLRRIAPGSFLMCNAYDVRLTKPFFIGIYEITQKQYELIKGSNPSQFKGDSRPVGNLSWDTIRGQYPTYNWPTTTNVDPNSAIGLLRSRTGIDFDLPTEAQWEYACRANTVSGYNNGGDGEEDLACLGRFKGNCSDGVGGYSNYTTVGSYLPNSWGIYDMHGNAREWCLEGWADGLVTDVVDPSGPSSCELKVNRGGSYLSSSGDCTASSRSCNMHSYQSNGMGFRIARTLSEEEIYPAEIVDVAGRSSESSINVKTVTLKISRSIRLCYSPLLADEVSVYVDDALLLSSTNSGVFAWQPRTTGTHTLKHVSGDYEWTRTVTVTGLAFEVPPAPNPPTAEDANISIGSTSRSFAYGGGSATITTSGSGTWMATASDDWITFPAYSSNTAGRPLAYRVVANSGVEERTGYIYVSGHVFTITQAGVGGALDTYSADFETDGGTDSFTVLADAQTSWKVRSNVDWISVAVEGTGNGEQGTVGIGEQMVLFTVAPWNEVSTRSGTITAAGCTFTVNQTGRRMKLAVADGGAAGAERQPYQVERDYLSHVIDVQVNALASTVWDIELDGTWISIVDGGTGHGAGSVTLAINKNPSWLERSGMVRIGTELLTINQAGRPSNALDFSISPESTTASVKGANALISVMATPDLPWTATSQANWLTIMPSFQQGAGNGNIVYTASPNPTMANRSGTIQIAATTGAALAAKTHRVSQPAATAMLSADAHTFDAAGETFDVDVTIDDIVNWTASENIDWLSVVGSTSRIGPGAVSLVATENPTVNPREADMTIAGHAFHVVQKGRTVEVEYTSRVLGTASDFASIDVHPNGSVTWVATTDSPDWIVIWGDDGCEYDSDGNVVGTGDHTIEYIVSDYVGDGTPRTGTITIGDKTVYITQRPYDLSINPSAATVGGNAGVGTVGVPATVGQVWNAIATEPWITVQSGYDAGTGSGTVRYTYTDNDTGEERTGRIIIAGEEYTITQAARQMVAVNVTTRVVTGSGEPTTGNGGVVSGAGTYDRGTSVTLTATANDGYEFVNWTLFNGSTTGGSQLVVTADVNKEIFANFRRIPVYAVNGEPVREGTSKTFTAPADVIDDAGTTKLVCIGTSRYPDKGTSFTLVVTEDISFEWDLWQTNYLVAVSQSSGGAIKNGSSLAPTAAWYPAGSTIDLTATPDSGKSFFRWNLSNPDNPVNPVENISAHSASLRLCVNTPTAVSAVFGTFNDTLATALDAPALTFTTGGDASWLPVIDATAQTGYTSARSGAIGVESETWLDTTVEGAGTLTFRWRVDCEKDDGGGATWDRLAVFTNGVEAARIDGKTGWQTVTIEIPNTPTPNSSTQTLVRWSFYRDDFDEPGALHENAAWVDGIIFNKEGNE